MLKMPRFLFSASGRKQEVIESRPSLPKTSTEVRSTSKRSLIRPWSGAKMGYVSSAYLLSGLDYTFA